MEKGIYGIGWFARRAPDTAAVIAFYRDVVGLPFLRGRENSGMFWAGESMVLWISSGGTRPPEYHDRSEAELIPIFRVRGIQGTIDRLEAGGARFVDDSPTPDGRLAFFADPSGHLTGIQERRPSSRRPEDTAADRRWEAGDTTIPGIEPLPADIQHLAWVRLATVDLPAMVAWYRDVLGFELVSDRGERGAMLYLGEGVRLQLVPGGKLFDPPTDRSKANNTIIFRTLHADDFAARLADRGVRFVEPPFTSSGRLAYFLDPEGRQIAIQERFLDSDRPEDREFFRRTGQIPE